MAGRNEEARVIWSNIDTLHRSERLDGHHGVASVVIDGSITLVYMPQAEGRLVVASADQPCVDDVVTRIEGDVLHVGRVHGQRRRRRAAGWTGVLELLCQAFGYKHQQQDCDIAPVLVGLGQSFAPNIVHNGSGAVHLAGIKQHDVDVEICGSASVEASGEVDYLQVVISGSGSFRGRDLRSLDASLVIAGSGSIKVEAKNRVRSNISGSGSITVFGAPAETTKKISGSGRVKYA